MQNERERLAKLPPGPEREAAERALVDRVEAIAVREERERIGKLPAGPEREATEKLFFYLIVTFIGLT